MTKTKFPSIADVAAELRVIAASVEVGPEDDEGEPYCEVRLQVREGGEWTVWWGDSQYDRDHRGFWGASSIPVGKRFDARDLARDLVEQAKDHAAQAAMARADALRFFLAHCGYSYHPDETPEQGRQRAAAILADAEAHASSLGWRVEWSEDPEPYQRGDGETEAPQEVLCAVLRDADGRVLASLGGIGDPSRASMRLIEAELADEARQSAVFDWYKPGVDL